MNERIQELAEQAGLFVELNDNPWPKALSADECVAAYNKFAQLIVKESINVVNKRYMGDNNREDFEVRRCVEDLKKHFGVE